MSSKVVLENVGPVKHFEFEVPEDGGRLRIATDRGADELFAELSHGERWKTAIDVCVSSVGNKALIVIPQEAWEGIDPANRTDLAEHARANRVTILTAESGCGPIEAERL